MLARRDMAAGARAAHVQPGLEILLAQGNSGRAAIDDGTDGRAVAFAPGGDPEQVSE